jgi:hypothetical protein
MLNLHFQHAFLPLSLLSTMSLCYKTNNRQYTLSPLYTRPLLELLYFSALNFLSIGNVNLLPLLELWPILGPYMARVWVAQFHIRSQGGVVEVACGTLVPHCSLRWTYTNIYVWLCEPLHM